jgi:hypothetical protein
MAHIMNKDYDKCIALMDLKGKETNHGFTDTLKSNFDGFRGQLISDFGEDLDFTYLRSARMGTGYFEPIPNTISISLQISGKGRIGLIELLYDKTTLKILTFKSLDIKLPIPDMTGFWLFGILVLCVLIFNIYMLIWVKRSDMQHKWLRYLIIIFINLFGIGYHCTQGFFYSWWGMQMFMGIGFKPMGYWGSSFMLAIPLGGIYTLWQLKTGRYKKDESLKPAPVQQIKGKRFKGK